MYRDQSREARMTSDRPLRWRVGLLVVVLACCCVGSARQLQSQEGPAEEQVAEVDPWAPLRLLEGTWEGSIDGRLGQGTGRRHYQFILAGKFLLVRHSSVRLPQEKSPRGDDHRELGVFSFDSERATIVFRQFLVEGFVARYTCDMEPKRFVCTSESVESGDGLRARETVEIEDRYRFVETFELASPGEELEVFFTNRWARVPALGE